MNLEFPGNTVLRTAGSSSVGSAIAKELAIKRVTLGTAGTVRAPRRLLRKLLRQAVHAHRW
jgi:short-subunit dehydrogenase involved in D-alanine esterification of teichoic acids